MKPRFFPGWWQVVVAMLVQAVSSASVFLSYSIIAAPLKLAFEPSNMLLMLGLTVAMITAGLLGPFIGAAIDRVSIRLLMLLGSGFLALGFLLLSFTTSMFQVLAIYMLVMSVGSLLLGQLSAMALLARWFTRRRGLAMGIATSGVALGGILVPPLLQFLMDAFEWREALRVFSGILLLLTAPFIAFLVVDRPADRNLQPDGDSEPPVKEPETAIIPTSSLLKSFKFWLLVMVLGTIFFGPFGLLTNMVPYVSTIGFDAATGALLLSIYSAASFVGKLACAGIADRVDHRLGLVGILLMLVLSTVAFMNADTFTMLVVGTVLAAVPSGAALPLRGVILASVYGPERLGRVMGLINMFTMPFTLVAPPLFGWVFDSTGSYWYAIAGYLVLLVPVTLLLMRTRLETPESVAAAAT